MAQLDRMIRRAARRVAADRALAGAAWGLLIGAAAGLGALGLSRVAGLPVADWIYPVLVIAAVTAALAIVLRRGPDRLELAVRLDRGLHLKDRLGTAEAVRAGRITGPFAELAARDAERLAARLDVRGTTPIRIARVWAPAAALTGLLAAGVLYMPAVAWAATGTDSAGRAAIQQRQRAEIVETIDEAIAGLDEDRLDDASRDELDLLDDLARQLGEPGATDPQLASARDESAARLEEMADRLAEKSQRNLDALDELTRRVTEFASTPEALPDAPPDGLPQPPPAPPAPPPPAARAAQQFTEALGAGEFEEAAEQFERLMEAAEDLPPEARERLAEQVRRLAEHLEQPQEPPAEQARRRELREALEDLGADEQAIDRVLEPASPDAEPPPSIDQAIDKQTGDEETRREMQRDLERLREQEQVRREAREQQRRLADGLKDAAERLEQTPEAQPQLAPRSDDRQPPPERPPPEQHQQQPDQQQPDQPQPDQPQREQQIRRQGEPTGERGDPGEPGSRPRQVPRPSPDQAPDDQAPPQGAPRPAPRQGPGTEPRGEAPPSPTELPQPGAEPGRRPDVGELLRRMQRLRRDAIEQAGDSERLRDAARRIADNLSEEEKQRLLEQWTSRQRQPAGEPPAGAPPGAAPTGEQSPGEPGPQDVRPFRNLDDLDLRDAGAEAEQVIAEWLSRDEDAGPPGQGDGTTGGVLRRARTEAEQAIEKSTVPSRYHELIRRYFGRIEEAARRAASPEPAEGPSEP